MLSDRDREMIRLAVTPYRAEGWREQHIRERFDVSSTRFWQRVNALVESPEAEAAMPVEVHRLQRLRDSRRRPSSR